MGIRKNNLKELNLESAFSMIPWSVLTHEHLSETAKLLYAELSSLTRQQGYSWVTNDYLSGILGKQKRTIQYSLDALKKAGLIHIVIKRENNQHLRLIYLDFRKLSTYPQFRGVQKIARGGAKNCVQVEANSCLRTYKEEYNITTKGIFEKNRKKIADMKKNLIKKMEVKK